MEKAGLVPWATQCNVLEGVLSGAAEKMRTAIPATVVATEASAMEMAIWEMKTRGEAAMTAPSVMRTVLTDLKEEFASITEPSEAGAAGDDGGSGIDGDMIVPMIGERRRSTSISSVSCSSSALHQRLAAFRVRLAEYKYLRLLTTLRCDNDRNKSHISLTLLWYIPDLSFKHVPYRPRISTYSYSYINIY